MKLVFSSFKIGNLFGVKDSVSEGLRSRVVYNFVCVVDRAVSSYTNKEKGENIRTRVAACRHLLSQTYTPRPDTAQRNSTEYYIATGSHVHAGKAMTISENNTKFKRYLQSKDRQIK